MNERIEWAGGKFSADVPWTLAPLHTDAWLVAPERTFDEVDIVLEQRVSDLQASFQAEGPNYLKQAYGVDKPLETNAARFLAYVELTDEYRQLGTDHRTYSQTLDANFQNEKQKLGGKKGKIRNLWQTKYNPAMNATLADAKEAERVQDLILRKATLELFAPGSEDHPAPVIGLPKILHDARERFWENQTPPDTFRTQRQPIENFFVALGGYINNTDDRTLFRRYEYRETPGIVATAEDIQVLDTMLQMGLATQSLTEDEAEALILERLGRDFFIFLSRREAHKVSTASDYRYLSLIYDMSAAALFRGNLQTISGLSSMIDSNLNDTVRSGALRSEIERWGRNWRTRYSPVFDHEHSVYQSLDDDESYVKIRDSLEIPPEKKLSILVSKVIMPKRLQFPPDVIDGATSIEERVFGTFNILKGVRANDSGMFPNSSEALIATAREMQGEFNKSIRYLANEKGLTPRTLEVYYSNAGIYPFPDLDKQRGISVDLRNLLHMELARRETNTEFDEGKYPLATHLKEIHRLGDMSPQYTATQIVIEYFDRKFRLHPEDIERILKENTYLWRMVLDNPKWFVSPRGDSFTRAESSDPQLGEYDIDSLTFNTDKRRPREHLVTVMITNFGHPLIFWLDTQGNLLDSTRQLLPVEPSYKQTFLNLVLKRLYTITSGVLSTAEGEEVEVGEGHALIWYKRAHYRKLESTDDNPITLQSYGARAHAAEIKAKYGINIYEENERRKKAGTLELNEFLTFVRETEPTIPIPDNQPNILKYKPEKLRIPR